MEDRRNLPSRDLKEEYYWMPNEFDAYKLVAAIKKAPALAELATEKNRQEFLKSMEEAEHLVNVREAFGYLGYELNTYAFVDYSEKTHRAKVQISLAREECKPSECPEQFKFLEIEIEPQTWLRPYLRDALKGKGHLLKNGALTVLKYPL